mgnify:CR=1 FL=1
MLHTRTLRLISGLMAALAPGVAPAQDAALVEAAKKEGAVTWYTTLLAQQFAEPASVAFQKKYGFKPTVVSLPVDIALRISNEANGGQYFVDVFDGTNTVAALRRWDLTLKWQPEIAKTLDRKSTRLNSSHIPLSRMPSSA